VSPQGTTMEKLFELFNLTPNEVKVYKALLRVKLGTKTPLVRESRVISSKIYEILDRLIQKGLVASFVQNGVKHYVPVQPSNLLNLFDNKIKELEEQRENFKKNYMIIFPPDQEFITEVQQFRGWDGLKSIFNLVKEDLYKGDAYYILGANPGVDYEKAAQFFSRTDKEIYEKGAKIKAIGNVKNKIESERYVKEFGKNNFELRYLNTIGPFEIGITNNLVIFLLLETNPIGILVNNRKIRDSFLGYFNNLWKIAK